MKLIAMPLILWGMTANSFAGGISAGGGGTLPAEPAGADTIREVVQHAKRELRLVFRYEQWSFKKGRDPLDDKLFGGAKTLLDVLESTDMDLEMNAPCYDANHVPVDGSIYASKPNAICLSAFTIGPKVIKERARIETLALITHELSHLLGSTEEEAVGLQKDVAFYLRETTDKSAVQSLDELGTVTSLVTKLQVLLDQADTSSYDDLSTTLSDITATMNEVDRWTLNFPYSIYTRAEYDFATVQSFRVNLVSWYATSLSTHADASYAAEKYEKVFNGKASVTYAEFDKINSNGALADNVFATQPMMRIHDRNDLKIQLAAFLDYYRALARRVEDLAYGRRMAPLPLPDLVSKPNAWANFAGDYTVVSQECKGDNAIATHQENLLTVSVHQTDKGQWYLKRTWHNSSAEDGLYDGAFDSSFGEATVDSSGGAATRTSAFGDSWNPQASESGVSTWTFAKIGEGYRFSKDETMHSYASDSSASCVFELRKN